MSRSTEQIEAIREFARDQHGIYKGMSPTVDEAVALICSGALDAALERLPKNAHLAAAIDWHANYAAQQGKTASPSQWFFGTWETRFVRGRDGRETQLELPRFFYDADARERGIRRIQGLPVDIELKYSLIPPAAFKTEAEKESAIAVARETGLAVDQQGAGLKLMTEKVWDLLNDMQRAKGEILEDTSAAEETLLDTEPRHRAHSQVLVARGQAHGGGSDGHSASNSTRVEFDNLARRARFMIVVDAATKKVIE